MANPHEQHPAYSGTFRHAMDSKHRVAVPSRWRQGDEEQFYLMPSTDGTFACALPPSEFRKVYDQLNNDPKISPADRRRFSRHFFSRAQHCVVDRQGRLLIPDELCRQAGLSGEVVMVGSFDRFEIWTPARWTGAQTADTDPFKQVADLIGF